MIKLKLLQNTKVAGKTILYRSPYDIGVKEKNGQYVLKDLARMKSTLPTLKYLLKKDCKIVALTYVKRPDGRVVEKLRTTPHAQALSRLLDRPVLKAEDCVGAKVQRRVSGLKPGQILMLENTRFHPEEMTDDDQFAQRLAKLGDLVVFDAFPQAHRIHASTTGILRHLPACAGFYFQKEVEALSGLLENTQRPFTVIIGGAKVSDKLKAINNLYQVADIFLVGGGVANVFLKAKDYRLGDSFLEDVFVDASKRKEQDWVEYVKKILSRENGDCRQKFKLDLPVELKKIFCPIDVVIGDSLENPDKTKTLSVSEKLALVPEGWAIVDISSQTGRLYSQIILQSKMVFWNGPMGVYEDERFAKGTKKIVESLKKTKAKTIIGGGDTVEILKKYADPDSFFHVSLAGGATLELLSGNKLPALEMLKV